MQPSLLVLDEPSANLDPRARRELLARARRDRAHAGRRDARPAVRRCSSASGPSSFRPGASSPTAPAPTCSPTRRCWRRTTWSCPWGFDLDPTRRWRMTRAGITASARGAGRRDRRERAPSTRPAAVGRAARAPGGALRRRPPDQRRGDRRRQRRPAAAVGPRVRLPQPRAPGGAGARPPRASRARPRPLPARRARPGSSSSARAAAGSSRWSPTAWRKHAGRCATRPATRSASPTSRSSGRARSAPPTATSSQVRATRKKR